MGADGEQNALKAPMEKAQKKNKKGKSKQQTRRGIPNKRPPQMTAMLGLFCFGPASIARSDG